MVVWALLLTILQRDCSRPAGAAAALALWLFGIVDEDAAEAAWS